MTKHVTRWTAGLIVLTLIAGWLAAATPTPVRSSEPMQIHEASISMMESGAVPEYFAVGQNYPNPFNASTNLEYDLPEAADVQIRVYNVLGREVRRLVDRNQQPGSYMAHWNGKGDQGNVMPSGLYFLVLLADDNYAIRKMMLVK